MKKFTKETLSNYNGQDGRPAYIAVNGIVYDITNNSHWTNGEYRHIPTGQDVSSNLTKTSQYGKNVLVHINQVGSYN